MLQTPEAISRITVHLTSRCKVPLLFFLFYVLKENIVYIPVSSASKRKNSEILSIADMNFLKGQFRDPFSLVFTASDLLALREYAWNSTRFAFILSSINRFSGFLVDLASGACSVLWSGLNSFSTNIAVTQINKPERLMQKL